MPALVDLRKRERETHPKLRIEGRIRPKCTRGIACDQILEYVFKDWFNHHVRGCVGFFAGGEVRVQAED